MLEDRLLADSRIKPVTVMETVSQNSAEVCISAAVESYQDKVLPALQDHFRANERNHPCAFHALLKLDCAKDAVVIGEAERRHAIVRRQPDKILYAGRPVEERIC